ncbi:MAG: xylose isomerase [Burkholderiaceae bacterium]|nr:xylose isomerase [Burkholderiaceae bacterium]
MKHRQFGDLSFGCTAGGTTHQDNNVPDIATKVAMVKDAGVFDYIDRTPPDEEFRDLLRASEKHDLPVSASGWFYTLGRDEALFERNIVKGRLLGTKVHNVQVMTHHAEGHVLDDEEVAAFYLRAHEFGMRHDVVPCFEVHVNMWSEHLGRVERVAALVGARGVPFHMTLDHSHVIFKIDNPLEQEVQDMKADVDAGRLILDPAKPGNVAKRWIDANFVHHAHARCAVPANPKNTWAKHPDGSFGRGIQYPFVRPGPGEYVEDDWDERRIEPWKRVVRDLFDYHATHESSPIRHISCEHIPGIDYGAGHKYSIFEQNIACARWLREQWADALARAAGSA